MLSAIQCQSSSASLACLCLATIVFLLWSCRHLLALIYAAVDALLDAIETLTTGSVSPSLPSCLPGPRGLPFLGYLPFIGRRPHVTLAALAARYGGRAFRLAAGCRRFVVISRIETVRALASLYPQQLRGKPRTFTTEQMTLGAHNDLVQRWKRRRSYTDAGLKLIEGSSIGDIVDEESQQLVDRLQDITSSSSSPSSPSSSTSSSASQPAAAVDIRDDIALYAARTMYRVSYGQRPESAAVDDLRRLVDTLPDYTTIIGSLSPFDVLPFWRRLRSKCFAKFVDFNRRAAAFCRREKERFLREADGKEATGSTDVPRSLFEFFRYKLKGQSSWERSELALTEDILLDGLEDIVRAGTESSSLVTKWFVLYVAAFPDVQRRMQAEIDGYLAAVGRDQLTADDLPQLTYCRAVLAETCRFCCLNPFLKRELTDDVILPPEDGGLTESVLLPRGTVLLFNSWAVNNDVRHWTHPELFRPERFLAGDDATELDEAKMELFMPFGFGKRRCIGVDTGRIVCLLAVARVARQFDLTLDGPADFDPIFGIGLAPKPFKLNLTPRTPSTI